ncbi:hypothetical protein FGO68_gene2138 [Halteria grandinella]|uniref:Uncharacterized protein n=1 Tax=Halteria grandinella TaxID=5974 RepID=A0A8J8NUE7_HALGN|nr:hypothetical protein FGO68_gene2138 [Halteria grandinella]
MNILAQNNNNNISVVFRFPNIDVPGNSQRFSKDPLIVFQTTVSKTTLNASMGYRGATYAHSLLGLAIRQYPSRPTNTARLFLEYVADKAFFKLQGLVTDVDNPTESTQIFGHTSFNDLYSRLKKKGTQWKWTIIFQTSPISVTGSMKFGFPLLQPPQDRFSSTNFPGTSQIQRESLFTIWPHDVMVKIVKTTIKGSIWPISTVHPQAVSSNGGAGQINMSGSNEQVQPSSPHAQDQIVRNFTTQEDHEQSQSQANQLQQMPMTQLDVTVQVDDEIALQEAIRASYAENKVEDYKEVSITDQSQVHQRIHSPPPSVEANTTSKATKEEVEEAKQFAQQTKRLEKVIKHARGLGPKISDLQDYFERKKKQCDKDLKSGLAFQNQKVFLQKMLTLLEKIAADQFQVSIKYLELENLKADFIKLYRAQSGSQQISQSQANPDPSISQAPFELSSSSSNMANPKNVRPATNQSLIPLTSQDPAPLKQVATHNQQVSPRQLSQERNIREGDGSSQHHVEALSDSYGPHLPPQQHGSFSLQDPPSRQEESKVQPVVPVQPQPEVSSLEDVEDIQYIGAFGHHYSGIAKQRPDLMPFTPKAGVEKKKSGQSSDEDDVDV